MPDERTSEESFERDPIGSAGINIVNLDEIDLFVDALSVNIDRTETLQWFHHNLRNFLCREPRLVCRLSRRDVLSRLGVKREADLAPWLRQALADGLALHWFCPFESGIWSNEKTFAELMFDVSAWLAALPRADRQWLSLERTAVPDAIAKALEWRRAIARDTPRTASEDRDGVRTIFVFADGMRFVQLLSRAALEHEASMMANCVASYAKRVETGRATIYSLRDSTNQAHVTIEVKKGLLCQAEGHGNSPVPMKWQPYIEAVAVAKGWCVGI